MADFSKAITYVIENEGGYTEDHAGATKYGITQKHSLLTKEEIQDLTLAEAMVLYHHGYWLDLYEEINSQSITTKLLDLVINMGHNRGHKLIQKACNTLSSQLVVDGIFGRKTLDEINSKDEKKLLDRMVQETILFYNRLVTSNPSVYSKYLRGWISRANRLPE